MTSQCGSLLSDTNFKMITQNNFKLLTACVSKYIYKALPQALFVWTRWSVFPKCYYHPNHNDDKFLVKETVVTFLLCAIKISFQSIKFTLENHIVRRCQHLRTFLIMSHSKRELLLHNLKSEKLKNSISILLNCIYSVLFLFCYLFILFIFF